MDKRQLQDIWELEGDATIGAGTGRGTYTLEVAKRLRNKQYRPLRPRVLIDCDPTAGPVRKLFDLG